MSKPVTAIIVGAGHRSLIYASLAELYPDKLKIVGVADPDDAHREQAVKRFHIAPDMIFHDAEELAAHPRLADAIINGTMDQQHVPTSIPLLKLGYDMLLEKPFCVNEEEMWELYAAAEKYGNKVMICHVLRYAPFYVDIKKRLPPAKSATSSTSSSPSMWLITIWSFRLCAANGAAKKSALRRCCWPNAATIWT